MRLLFIIACAIIVPAVLGAFGIFYDNPIWWAIDVPAMIIVNILAYTID